VAEEFVATHISRKDLKQDVVAETVEHQIHWFAKHKQSMIRYGIIAVVLVAVVWGGLSYRDYSIANRQHALAEALAVQVAPVGQAPPNGGLSFATEEARAVAAEKAFAKVSADFAGDEESNLANYYLAGIDADNGKLDAAMKKYQDVAAHAGPNYASIAKLAMAQLHFAQGKNSEAKAILKDLADHPTDLVSKEQADVILAKGIAATEPEEARKLLVPIASKVGRDITQVATAALAEIQKK
jgi:predicted negative regulator of RcsB-dependent stress response